MQLRGGNEPWERKFEGKSRLYEQKLHTRPDGWTRWPKTLKSDTSSKIHKVDADGATRAARRVHLPESVEGGTPRTETRRERQVFAAWREPLNWEERRPEEVANTANLEAACQKVISNKGAAGVDGMTVMQLRQWSKHHLTEMREQPLHGRYRPQEVKGVSIPKPSGGVRRPGIPTVIDRMVQQAIVQVLTPILDPQMSESSYGFRPRRKAHDALQAGSQYEQ